MLGGRSDQRGLWEADRLYLDLVGRDSFYGLLASLRGQLFHDADFAELYCLDNGRASVPPSLLATTLLLQAHDKVSDAEAKARADFDIRWKVALGIEIEERSFAKSTLPRARCQEHVAKSTLPRARCQEHVAKSTLPRARCTRARCQEHVARARCQEHVAKSTHTLPRARCQEHVAKSTLPRARCQEQEHVATLPRARCQEHVAGVPGAVDPAQQGA